MKIGRVICGLCLLLVSLLAIYQPADVLAQEEPLEESINMVATYPMIEGISGSEFEFEVELKYTGEEARVFDLVLTAPQGWSVYSTPQYGDTRIRNIRLEPAFAAGTKIKVITAPPIWPLSDPGEYKTTLEATSGDITGTIELTAAITAKYTMVIAPVDNLYNTTAQAGKDNFFTIEVGNLGTAPINDINFSSSKPSGWTIEFTPEKIESLPAFDSQTVDVNIKPPTETIAGDYKVTIRASGEQTSESIDDIRVTVETPAIWGWVGVGIIALVIAGLVYVFMRFSRR